MQKRDQCFLALSESVLLHKVAKRTAIDLLYQYTIISSMFVVYNA